MSKSRLETNQHISELSEDVPTTHTTSILGIQPETVNSNKDKEDSNTSKEDNKNANDDQQGIQRNKGDTSKTVDEDKEDEINYKEDKEDETNSKEDKKMLMMINKEIKEGEKENVQEEMPKTTEMKETIGNEKADKKDAAEILHKCVHIEDETYLIEQEKDTTEESAERDQKEANAPLAEESTEASQTILAKKRSGIENFS
ncbi:chromo domain-containing protein cec-1-like [Chenopodium quinoa]|uniref:chromo domain-containing protein cec-1-like n=1 Tax=Chenopodium quinoa TaxID=63459 RepID=UPI000B772D0F|nr:chromo domain-containing protein cec-1-like [Chenopodium quinoa]